MPKEKVVREDASLHAGACANQWHQDPADAALRSELRSVLELQAVAHHIDLQIFGFGNEKLDVF